MWVYMFSRFSVLRDARVVFGETFIYFLKTKKENNRENYDVAIGGNLRLWKKSW